MLILSKDDLLKAVTPEEMMGAIEEAMRRYETKDFSMPSRMHIYHEEDVLLLMPCFVKEGFGTKLVTVFPGNADKGVPVTTGLMVLNDMETGEPVAVMNGQILTALRTGAVGGAGIRHTAKADATKLGVIGAGGQGLFQAYFGAHARPVTEIHVFDTSSERVDNCLKELATMLPNVKLIAAPSVEALLEAVDMVITATTAMEPILPDNPELLKGKSFVGIGSFKPDMREYPQALFPLLKQVLVDTEYAKEETGDLAIPLQEGWITDDQVSTLGNLWNQGEGQDLGETTFFKSVGMALFDVMVAQLIYNKARELGIGQDIDI